MPAIDTPTATVDAAPSRLEGSIAAELQQLVVGGQLVAGPGSDIAQSIAALQADAGLAITGSLGASDIATLRSIHGTGLFQVSIAMAKEQLQAAGYEIAMVDGDFDTQMATALMAMSHDQGQTADPTLSVPNIGLLSSGPTARSCPTLADGVPFLLPDAQALVDLAEQLFESVPVEYLATAAITGDSDLDERIVKRARERGYRLRPAARVVAVVNDAAKLDPRAAEDWARLQQAATQDGISMYAASGYRAPDLQLTLFQRALAAQAGPDLLSSQVSDSDLDLVLDSHAPPGFSKHQTGLAVDIASPDGSLTGFAATPGFEWLTRNNYENARRFGFVPSYPSGVDGLGPAPEPWEWLWVGTAALYRCPPTP